MNTSLSVFTGTENYTSGFWDINLTDGVAYISNNGASWLISDICSILKFEGKVKAEEFVCIKVKFADNKAEAIYTDGNENILYTQKYKWTDFNKHFAEKEVIFFFTNNVLMLGSEY